MRGRAINMTQITELISDERLQYLVFIALSIGVVGLTGIIYFSNNLVFSRLIGTINPFTIIIPIIFVGLLLFSILLSHNWFAIYKKGNPGGMLLSAILASILGIIIILVDHKIVYPKTINVPFPESFAYYPSVGFCVEILFHVLPVSLVTILLSFVFKNIDSRKIIWISILIASLVEPIFQSLDLLSYTNQYPLWAVLFTGLHVFVINFLQLLVFKRHDFVAMYSFRLVYYLFWHIGWGYIRLQLLF
jgi:hypothetical protein